MIRYHTLGDAAIEVGGTRLGPSSSRAFATLLFLAAERDRRVTRASLQELLFPGATEANAAHSLRQLLYRLRQLAVPFEADVDSVGLRSEVVSDDYSALLASKRYGPQELDAIAGGFLPGYAPAFSQPFTEWCDGFRSRVTLRLRRALVEQLAELRRRGEWRELERAARACLALDPLNEEGTLALAEALAMSGSKVEALRLLERYAVETERDPSAIQLSTNLLRRRISEKLDMPSSASANESILFGRQAEIAVLTEHLRLSMRGYPTVVLIRGEAGIGKSRLANELLRKAVLMGAVVQKGAFELGDDLRPLSAFSRILTQLMALPGALGCSPQSLKWLALLAPPQLSRGAEGRNEFTYQGEGGIAETTRREIRTGVLDLLEAISSETPLVLLLEDLQHADTYSVNLLKELGAGTSRASILILLTARDAKQRLTCDQQEGHWREVRVTTLPPGADRELLEHLAGSRLGIDVRNWILRVAGGNPLFLHSLVAHYRASGTPFSVPSSLTELFETRVTELDTESRLTLQAAAVLGQHSTVERLEQTVGLGRKEFLVALQRLEEGALITTEGDCIRPVHDLLSQVLLEKTVPSVRRVLHRRAAELLEHNRTQVAFGADSWACARHWQVAGDQDRTVAALRKTSLHALSVGGAQEACTLLERALLLPTQSEVRISILKELAGAAQVAEDWNTTARSLRALRTLAAGEPSQPSIQELEALYKCGEDPVVLRDEIIERLQEALPDVDRLRLASLLISVADHACDEAAGAHGLQQADKAVGLTTPESHFDRLSCMLKYHASFGSTDEALKHARNLYTFALGIGSPGLRCRALSQSALALYRCGDVERSCTIASELLGAAQISGLFSFQLWATSHLAWHCLNVGDYSAAIHWCELGENVRERSGRWTPQARHFANCIESELQRESTAEAAVWLAKADASLPRTDSGKARLVFEALRLRIQAKRHEAVDVDSVQSMLEPYYIARAHGLDDIVTSSLWFVLKQLGKTHDAMTLVRDYMRLRKYRYPPSAELQRICAEIGE